MEFGSLRNFIMTRYQEARQSRIFVDKMTSIPTSIRNEQDELLSFAYDVVRGMDFLAERKVPSFFFFTHCFTVFCMLSVLEADEHCNE